jgi:Ca2+/Na+ antiporter
VRLDRRVPFFVVVAAICFALVPLADKSLRHVPVIVGFAYLVLAALFLLDWLGRRGPGGPSGGDDRPD